MLSEFHKVLVHAVKNSPGIGPGQVADLVGRDKSQTRKAMLMLAQRGYLTARKDAGGYAFFPVGGRRVEETLDLDPPQSLLASLAIHRNSEIAKSVGNATARVEVAEPIEGIFKVVSEPSKPASRLSPAAHSPSGAGLSTIDYAGPVVHQLQLPGPSRRPSHPPNAMAQQLTLLADLDPTGAETEAMFLRQTIEARAEQDRREQARQQALDDARPKLPAAPDMIVGLMMKGLQAWNEMAKLSRDPDRDAARAERDHLKREHAEADAAWVRQQAEIAAEHETAKPVWLRPKKPPPKPKRSWLEKVFGFGDEDERRTRPGKAVWK
jgi:hypothetical protein